MKTFIVIVAILGYLGAGCSTTTYLNLTENDKGKIKRELNAYEKDKNVGAEVVLLLNNKTEIEGELLSVRDSALIICTEYSATEEELANSVYPVILVRNNEIQEITIEGNSYVWWGIGIGYLTGAIIGYLLGQTGATNDNTDQAFSGLGGGILGGLIGLAAGGGIGYAFSTEEFVLQEIPSGYDFYFLKPFARYPDTELEYLKVVE